MPSPKQGSRVRVDVEIRNDEGEAIERSHPDDPLEFEIGEGALPEEVEKALVGTSPGETVEVRTPPGVAFADHNPEAIVSVPREDLAGHEEELERGGVITVTVEHDDGSVDELDAVILEVNADAVILDANHPLAGQAAVFCVTLVAVV